MEPATTGAVVTGPGVVLAANVGGKLLASEDEGATWRALGQKAAPLLRNE